MNFYHFYDATNPLTDQMHKAETTTTFNKKSIKMILKQQFMMIILMLIIKSCSIIFGPIKLNLNQKFNSIDVNDFCFVVVVFGR